ncbi:restriction endonuclease subunit S [Alteromonas macleodii]|uniref:restriction endonuclease subunit S n=1 Tax=Alteromonas macleodii TaxID=28108 RepID=UPI0013051BE4|nr:restriction endonuclease subunit S [Alteromonas macleodii]
MSNNTNLPKGWASVEIDEIVLPIEAVNPADYPNEEISYLDISSVDNEKGSIDHPKILLGKDAPSRARQIVRPEDTIFSTVRPYLKAIAMVSPTIKRPIASTGFCVLRACEGVNSRYLFYFVRSDQLMQEIIPLQRGVSYPAIRSKDLLSRKIPTPPTNEQNRIADKIDELFSELDAGINELKIAQLKLQHYRQSLLKSAVEGALTQKWRDDNKNKIDETGAELLNRILTERKQLWEQNKLAEFKEKNKKPPKNWQAKYPEPVQPVTTDLPELPEGWVWATIDQLAINKRYGSSSKTNDDASGVPVLRMGNIQDGKLDYDNLKYLPEDHKEFPELLLNDGDLLFNRTNSAELVGKTAVYKDIGKPVSYASYLISVTFSEHFLPEFAAHYINSVLGKKWIAEVMNQTAGQANVNGTKLGALPIPLPSILEQRVLIDKVSNEFDSIDLQIEATALGLNQSNAQRKNILKSAFSGLLVPQDKSDEPASVLLEKIKRQREAMPKKPKTKQSKTKLAMKKITIEELAKWVDKNKSNSFTFEELQTDFQGDYDQLKDCVFEILSADKPLFKQVFDQKLNTITFIKEDK